MGKGVLDALAEDPFEREHQTWPEREEREQNATHIAMLAVEPDGGLDCDGASRTRTGDLLGAIQALSQLSYSPAADQCS